MLMSLISYYKNNHIDKNFLGTAWRLEDRGRIITKIISKWSYLRKQSIDILDIGCRDGTLMAYLLKQADVPYHITGADIDLNALARYKVDFPEAIVKLEDCNGNLSFTNKCFDIVLAGEVIEHLINPELFLSEVNRILRPGGLFVGSAPNAFKLDKRLRLLLGNDPKSFSDHTHTQYFSHNSLRELLNQNFPFVKIFVHPQNILTSILPRIFSSGFIWQIKK